MMFVLYVVARAETTKVGAARAMGEPGRSLTGGID
jgi:hypothetical protein